MEQFDQPPTTTPPPKHWGRRSATFYNIMVAYRYHRKRQRFFDLLDKCTKALTVIAGGSLLAAPIKEAVPIVAMIISALGLLSLVFAYGDRKQSHKELSEAFTNLAAKIEETPAVRLTSEIVAGWEADVSLLKAKEPPQLHTLITICEREQSIANGHPNHIPPVPFGKRLLADFVSFGSFR